MKIKPRDIEGFVKRPDPDCRCILVFGPNQGLVHERAKQLVRTVLEDPADPFRLADLDDADLKKDPARLADEADAISMLGGRRVVRIRNASDSLAKPFLALLEGPPVDALVVASAGNLAPRSPLRKAFEKASGAAALPCYDDDARTLSTVIRDTLRAAQLEIDPDASAFLLDCLGNDRSIALNELQKLVLYMHNTGETGPHRITLEDARACVGDSAAVSLDIIMDASAGGDTEALGRALGKALEADMAPVAILAALVRHFQTLHFLAGRMEAGTPCASAIKALQPPVHFRREAALNQQLRLWTRSRIERAMVLLADADRDCKTTGLPARAICGYTLLRIAKSVHAARRPPPAVAAGQAQ